MGPRMRDMPEWTQPGSVGAGTEACCYLRITEAEKEPEQ